MAASLKKTPRHDTVTQPVSGSATLPVFDFAEFFHGHTRASGWFADRFGTPRRHFFGDFYGYYDQGKFILDEKLFYTDGVIEERVWKVKLSEGTAFSAQSDSLINEATGVFNENTLLMNYTMELKIADGKFWKLDMKDLMMLQPDGSLHNINHVYKWGIRIGTVAAQYVHHDGDRLCMPADGKSDSAAKQSAVAKLRDNGGRHLSTVDK